jgi:hypothetical protein
MQLSLVAEIPDKVAGARLAVKQSGQRFDTVTIDQQHRRKLMPSKTSGKTLKLIETTIYTNSNPQPQERHFLPGSSAGVSVPEKR